ncbi:aspartate carbamoyltransferase [Candidatus Photodesmus blepharus]|uniref:Aspartate carbamoyltransferase n=1 Tax=Candidatus Photodesmus blepharonis TaxID=1179155 RepID=A0A084CN78_9GAMM|nr:aspartate carbamoyltransferase [Candidatus Photodesmus blepharus]KEY91257.1 aspartate carbamoyltransferase [Candidatus Photodesmus blepharus]
MAHSLFNKHIISIPELARSELEMVINTTKKFKAKSSPELLKNKVIASCFFEPSTRTRLSFETAVQRLGGTIVGFDNGSNISLTNKGETLADSIRVISSYVDAFVIRHPQEGAARLASEFSQNVPVINAGDGANQHPSQTLSDLFSVYETQSTLDNLNIAFVGDLKYGRTVHSLAQALSKFNGSRFFFISPEVLAMPDYICQELSETDITYSKHSSIEEVIPELDVLYMTRIQKERFDESEYAHIRSDYILTKESLKNARHNMKVLHPLPRIDEIATNVDQTSHAYYFEQAENGVYARKALLALVLNNNL